MVPGLGGGFAQVVQEGLSSLTQSEPLVGRIKLERIRGRIWVGFAVGGNEG